MDKQALRTWGVILVLVIVAGAVAVSWPSISAQFGGSSTRVPAETQHIEIPLPPLGSLPESITLTSFQVMAALLAIVVGAVVGAGVLLSLLYVRLAGQTADLAEDDGYKGHLQALEERTKAQLKQMSESRTTHGVPDHEMPRWSVLSTSLIILTFVVFLGMLISATFVPEGEFVRGGRLVSANLVITGSLVLVTLLILVWRFRSRSLAKVEASDNDSIPWDAVWVVLTGVLVVGLGLGLVVYLNVPA